MGMLQANPKMALNKDFMEDLLRCQLEVNVINSKMVEEEKEEELKDDGQEWHAQQIANLMESTLKPRESVVAALKLTYWDPN